MEEPPIDFVIGDDGNDGYVTNELYSTTVDWIETTTPCNNTWLCMYENDEGNESMLLLAFGLCIVCVLVFFVCFSICFCFSYKRRQREAEIRRLREIHRQEYLENHSFDPNEVPMPPPGFIPPPPLYDQLVKNTDPPPAYADEAPDPSATIDEAPPHEPNGSLPTRSPSVETVEIEI